MKDDIDTPHIEDRTDGLNVSNLGKKRLEILCQNNFGASGVSLENQKGHECFTFSNSPDNITS